MALPLIPIIIISAVAGGGGWILFSNKAEGYHMLSSAKSNKMKGLLKNAKGAEIAYDQAIEEDRGRYQLAADTYSSLSGELLELKVKHDTAERAVAQLDQKIERLVPRAANGDSQATADLRLLGKSRASKIVEVEGLRAQGERLAPAVYEAKNIMEECETILANRERDKGLAINEYKLTESMKKTYAALDKLRADTNTSKMLKAVDEGLSENKRLAAGAQMVHNNKVSTQLDKLDKRLTEGETDDYISGLLEDYKKKNS